MNILDQDEAETLRDQLRLQIANLRGTLASSGKAFETITLSGDLFSDVETLTKHKAELERVASGHSPAATQNLFTLNERTSNAVLGRLRAQSAELHKLIGIRAESLPTLRAPEVKPKGMTQTEFAGHQLSDIATIKAHVATLLNQYNASNDNPDVFAGQPVPQLLERCASIRANLETLRPGCTASVPNSIQTPGFTYDALNGEFDSLMAINNSFLANHSTTTPMPAATASTENLWHNLEFCVGLHREKNGAAVFQRALSKKLVTAGMINSSSECARLETILADLKSGSKEHGVVSSKLANEKAQFEAISKK